MSTISIPASFPKYGSTIEHLIAYNFIRAMQAQGFEPSEYDDGGEDREPITPKGEAGALEAMEAIFAVEDCTIYFRSELDRRVIFARFIVGNGCDLLSDYSGNEYAQKAADACETIAAGNHEAALDVVTAALVAERGKVARLKAALRILLDTLPPDLSDVDHEGSRELEALELARVTLAEMEG